ELAVEPDQLILPLRELLKRPEQLLVLALDLVDGVRGPEPRQGLGYDYERVRAHEAARARQELAETHGGAAGRRRDREAVHEPLRPRDAEPHAGVGAVATLEHRPQVGDAAATIGHLDRQELRDRHALDAERHLAAARVAE